MASDEREEVLADDEIVLRRLSLATVVPEGGEYRISSGAFRASPQKHRGLSVHWEALASPEMVRELWPGVGIARISVGRIKAEGDFRVIMDPRKDDPGDPDDPSHALIVPLPRGGVPGNLAGAAELERRPDHIDEVREIAERLAEERGRTAAQVWNDAVREFASRGTPGKT